MSYVIRVGIDLAKSVLQITAMDDDGTVVERNRLRRVGPESYVALLPRGCTIAMKACGSAHD